jgi:hypothetical protein
VLRPDCVEERAPSRAQVFLHGADDVGERRGGSHARCHGLFSWEQSGRGS